jgi:hypothetical protein
MPTTLTYHDGQAYIEAGPNDPYPVLLYGANGQPLLFDASGNIQVVGNVAHDSPDSGNPVKIGGVARSSVPSNVTAGDRVDATFAQWGGIAFALGSSAASPFSGNIGTLVDLAGNARPLAVAPQASSSAATTPTNSTSTAEEASRVVKASAGTLYGFSFYNNNAATRYVQFFNTASLPADAVIPTLTIPVATQQSVHVDFGIYGRRFDTGIVVCNSSTDTAKTIGAADSLFDVQYV